MMATIIKTVSAAAFAAVAVLLVQLGTTSQLAAAPAADESPADYCRRVGVDDEVRAAPPALEAALRRAFNVNGAEALQTSFFRCAHGRVMLCTVGANLVCDKANMSKELSGASDWCREHQNARDIPMAATGHDTIYEWRCAGTKAVAGRRVLKVDRGFIAENWKSMR